MKTIIKISDRLAELMDINSIDGTTLATQLDVSKVAISNWKNGKGYFRLNNCIKIVDYFNCSIDFLVGRSDIVIDFIPK